MVLLAGRIKVGDLLIFSWYHACFGVFGFQERSLEYIFCWIVSIYTPDRAVR